MRIRDDRKYQVEDDGVEGLVFEVEGVSVEDTALDAEIMCPRLGLETIVGEMSPARSAVGWLCWNSGSLLDLMWTKAGIRRFQGFERAALSLPIRAALTPVTLHRPFQGVLLRCQTPHTTPA